MTGGLTLDEVERRLPIPGDVLIVESDDLPSGNGWWVPKHRVILTRHGLRPAERNVVLAHEAAHIVLGHHGAMAADRDIESEADQLAAVLLLGAVTAPARRRGVRRVIATMPEESR